MLPADSFIGRRSLGATRLFQIYQIDDFLIPANAPLQKVSVEAACANDHNLGVSQNFIQIGIQKGSDVRNNLLDIFAV